MRVTATTYESSMTVDIHVTRHDTQPGLQYLTHDDHGQQMWVNAEPGTAGPPFVSMPLDVWQAMRDSFGDMRSRDEAMRILSEVLGVERARVDRVLDRALEEGR